MCDKIIKLANLHIKGRIEQLTRVYSTKGISPTLNSAMGHGGGCIPLFLIIKRDMRKAILYKERTAEGRMLRKAYDTHKCSFQAKMKHRTPRTDGLSNTITSFFTDNLVLIVKEI